MIVSQSEIDRELREWPGICLDRRRIARNRILQRQAIEREKRGTRSVLWL